ncbi:MinD/ParA family ATP-binding protein [Micromonospora schwarzwaldensis]|uniref:MinD/ParA family ATP-binding protein n=1 Tax=Micromonospora sp. DSM 45708 TaxID=3111767 RepID=UPI0031E14DC0
MVHENDDRAHVAGRPQVPERDIEPLWPPEEIDGMVTAPPWAAPAQPVVPPWPLPSTDAPVPSPQAAPAPVPGQAGPPAPAWVTPAAAPAAGPDTTAARPDDSNPAPTRADGGGDVPASGRAESPWAQPPQRVASEAAGSTDGPTAAGPTAAGRTDAGATGGDAPLAAGAPVGAGPAVGFAPVGPASVDGPQPPGVPTEQSPPRLGPFPPSPGVPLPPYGDGAAYPPAAYPPQPGQPGWYPPGWSPQPGGPSEAGGPPPANGPVQAGGPQHVGAPPRTGGPVQAGLPPHAGMPHPGVPAQTPQPQTSAPPAAGPAYPQASAPPTTGPAYPQASAPPAAGPAAPPATGPVYPPVPGPPRQPAVPPGVYPEQGWPAPQVVPPTAEDFARRRQVRPVDPVATMGVRAVVNRIGLVRLAPGRHEQEMKRDIEMVRRNFGGLRQVTVVNPKGGAGKTVAILLLAMTFGQKRGGYVLAWDNNETQGTLGMRAQQDFHARTVRDMLRDLGQFQGAQGRVGDLSQYVRSQGEGMFDVLASDESATGGEMLTAAAFAEIRDVVSRFYKLIFVDTGNNVRAQNWQAAMDATDQLVVTMSARNDSAETAARMLDHLEQSGRQRLVRQAVTVVSMPPSRKEIDLPAIQAHFAARTRAVLLAPYERLIDTGEPLRYGQLSAATRDAWLKIAASVAEGL